MVGGSSNPSASGALTLGQSATIETTLFESEASIGAAGRDRDGVRDQCGSEIGEALARRLELFGELSNDDRQALVAVRGKIEILHAGQDILRFGDHPTASIIVLEGLLHCYTATSTGGSQIHGFYLPPDTPCLETLYLDYMDHGLAATVESRIGVIPHRELYALIDERPCVRKLIWRQTLVQGAMFRAWLVRNSTKQAGASLAHFMCEMFVRCQTAGLARGTRFDLPISQLALAQALGMTAVHTNRSLKFLRECGMIEWNRGKATILDWDKLVTLAEFDPSYLHLHRGGGSLARDL